MPYTEQARTQFASRLCSMDGYYSRRAISQIQIRCSKRQQSCDYHVKQWFTDTHQQLSEVVKNYMEKQNV